MKTEFRKNEGDVVRSLLDGMFYRVLSIKEGNVDARVVEEEEADGKRVFVETSAVTERESLLKRPRIQSM